VVNDEKTLGCRTVGSKVKSTPCQVIDATSRGWGQRRNSQLAYHHLGIRTLPHLAFAVDDLDGALEGKQILIPPNSPSHGVRVAFILDDGAPIELLEFDEADSG
jgi:hypothetical protein